MSDFEDRVRAGLSRRGAHNVDDAIKLFEVQESDLADERALSTVLDAFARERPYLFAGADFSDMSKPVDSIVGAYIDERQRIERAEHGRREIDFSDESRTIDEITADFVRQELA